MIYFVINCFKPYELQYNCKENILNENDFYPCDFYIPPLDIKTIKSVKFLTRTRWVRPRRVQKAFLMTHPK